MANQIPASAQLTPFEHYMLADSDPSIPMGDCYRLHFSGTADQEKLTEALHTALARHPLLTARVEGHVGQRTAKLRWQFDPPIAPYLSWGSLDETIEMPPKMGRMVNAERGEPGMRIYVRTGVNGKGETQTMILIQVHHMFTDAAGLLSYLEDALAIYDGRELPAIDREALISNLARRHQLHEPPGKLRQFVARWRRHLRFFSRLPIGFANPEPKFNPLLDWPGAMSWRLSTEHTRRLKQRAKAQNASPNDLLLRDLFLTLAHWNKDQGRPVGWRPLRISMAMNMRDESHGAVSACNIVSMCYLDRNGRELADPDSLLQSIKTETQRIKAQRLGSAMIEVLRWVGSVPQLLKVLTRPLPDPPCMCTTALSNLGRPFAGSTLTDDQGILRSGGLTLRQVEAMPSGRPYLPIAFTTNNYGHAQCLTLSFNPDQVNPQLARELLQRYAWRVQTSLNQSLATAADGANSEAASSAFSPVRGH